MKRDTKRLPNGIDLYRNADDLYHRVVNGDITPATCQAAVAAIRTAIMVVNLQHQLGNKALPGLQS